MSAAVLRFSEPDQKPDRHDDDGAEQEIAPQPAQDIEAHGPDLDDEGADLFDDIPGIEADGCQDHAHQDRQQDKASDHGQRWAAQKAVNELVGVCLLFRHRNLRWRHLAKLLRQAQA